MNRSLPEITESVPELKKRLRGESVGYKKQRLTALYLLQSGEAKNRQQVAALIGVNRKTVGHWLDAYQAGGIDQMLYRRYPPGRSPLLSTAQLQALRAELDKPCGFSSYGAIQQFIASTYQVEMSYKAVYSLVHDKWQAKLKVPRKSHEKKNEALTETFVSTFQFQVEAAISEKQSPSVRLFCQDESRFGILPVVQTRITACGVKPVATVDYRYDWFYLYGAVEPRTGERFFLQLPRLTAECFQIFIDEFSATFPNTLNIMVLDNGQFHHAKSLVIPDNVVLMFLPPYSPELNPIERLWQAIKYKLFTHTYRTLDQMQQQLSEILATFTENAVAKITAFSYFINTANAI